MTPITAISFINHSNLSRLNEALPKIVHALSRQLAEHVQPVWGRVLPALAVGDALGPSAVQMVIFDDADQPGALGYHDEGPDGKPFGRVFVGPIIDYGGDIMTSSNSVSVTLSHELLEMVGDPSCNWWADGPGGYAFALELGDPVEADAYPIDGAMVSNFVYPAFFDPQAEPSSKFDYLGKLTAPFTMTSGGYLIRRTENGIIDNVWGEHVPDWKREQKKRTTSRAMRRST